MLEDLKACKTRRALANVLEIPEKELTYVLYSDEAKPLYKSFCISKKSGGTRQISAPIPKLKFIQRKLLCVLQECDTEIRNTHKRSSNYQFGFRKGTNIWGNARPHCKKRFVLNIDIKNYFDQINFGRVRGFFIKSKDFSLNQDVATVLAQIVCYDNKLPQGSPTSSLIAGLVTEFFDVRITRFLANRDCTYSRYCDDISISTNQRAFPKSVATQDPVWPGGWKLSEDLEGIFIRSGLPINYDKLRMSHNNSQKMATGLVVNRYPNIPAKFYGDTRVWLDHYARTGRFVFKEFTESFGENCPVEDLEDTVENENNESSPRSSIERLSGRLAHIYHIRSKSVDIPFPTEVHEGNPQFWELLQKFVFVRNFVANEQATVLTEGPSDIIHIKAAIRLNPTWAPHLFDQKENRFRVRFFPHSGIFAKSMGVEGGAGDLGRFLNIFYQPPKRVNLRLRRNSVILVTDNDKACNPIFNRLSNAHKQKISYSEKKFAFKLQDFFYLLKAPQTDTKEETCIEDMLSNSALSTPIDGKTFEPEKSKFDETKHLSKVAFASALAKEGDISKYAGFKDYIAALDKCVSQTL